MTPAEPGSRDRSRAQRLTDKLTGLLRQRELEVRFLIVGVWNAAFSVAILWVVGRVLPYAPGSWLAGAAGDIVAKQVVIAIAWVLSVTQNLFSFKLLVFRTKGHWLREYARMFVTYAGTFVVESVMMQVLSATLGWSLVLAKIPTLVVVTVLSYIGHRFFTFRSTRAELAADLDASPDDGELEPGSSGGGAEDR